MGNLREEFRALQARLDYVERREREREQDLSEQLSTLQRTLEETRAALSAADSHARAECAQLQREWRDAATAGAAEKAARESHCESLWRERLAEERRRCGAEGLQRVAGALEAQMARLAELTAERRAAAEAHAQWAARHAAEEARLRAFVEETYEKLSGAIAAERQAREDGMRRIEQLLTTRTVNARH